MKIYSKKNLGFQEVYTHKNALPKNIEQPKKKPFIILALPADSWNISSYLIQNFPLFKKLGYSEVQGKTQILTITSKRKVGIVINSILSSPDYNHEQNAGLLRHLILIQQNLAKTTKIYSSPPKSKARAQYHPVNDEIIREENAPKPSHSAEKVKKVGKPEIEILKKEESGRRITEIEAFNGMCYRLLLNDRTPKVRSVHNNQGNRFGVISRAIDNFQSLHDYYLKEQKKIGFMRSPLQQDLVKSGIGRILGAAYAEEENDLHGGNIGYDPINIRSYKIDHDQATWPITSKYQNKNPDKPLYEYGERAYGIKPKDAFPITQRDITNFPHLHDAKPRNFPDKTDSGLLDLAGIENNPDFIKDVFSVFLKRALFDEQVYRAIANETIGNPKLREELVAHKTRRSTLLKEELIKNKKFLNFLIDNPNLKDQIIDELREYNNDYKENSPLRLDLEDLGSEFDALVAKTSKQLYVPESTAVLFETYYQPDQDVNAYEYKTATIDSSPRKQETKNHLKLALNVNDNEAEFIFNKLKRTWLSNPINSRENIIERNAEKTLTKIVADVISLGGKVGAFGCETRKLDKNNEIKIPRGGAAAIFDLYKKYQNHELPSAVATLEAIIRKATIANTYQGHTLFHRSQTEIADFYNSIVAIQHKILTEDDMNYVLTEEVQPCGICI